MSEDTGLNARRTELLAALLEQSAAQVTAAAADGHMVPMPAGIDLPPERLIEVPAGRATLLDLVDPADALVVVSAWEQVLARGWALGTVRLRATGELPHTLTFIDVRPLHGVLLGAVQPHEVEDGAEPADESVDPGRVSRRPRTATVRKNGFAVLTAVDERTTRMLGWTAEEMVGSRSTEFIHPDDHERAIGAWLEMLAGQETQRVRLRHRTSDGQWLWLELENQFQPAEDPADAVVVTQMTDISDEMAAQEALRAQAHLLRRVAESVPVGIVQLSTELGLVYANSRAAALLEVPEVTGVADLFAALDDVDRADLASTLDGLLDDELAADALLELHLHRDDADGGRICSVTATSLSAREGIPGVVLTLSDVTESARLREQLTVLATVDDLTGCANRAATMAFLEQSLQSGGDALTAVVFVDLDRFKPINDTFGHAAGDELLREAARRLRGVLRSQDLLGRIGGDEFLLVLGNQRSPDSVLGVAARARAALTAPVALPQGVVDLQASIGISCVRPHDEPGVDSTVLTRRADRAMYRSKHLGGGTPVLWSPADDTADDMAAAATARR